MVSAKGTAKASVIPCDPWKHSIRYPAFRDMVEGSAEPRAELTTFQCKECYVYRPPPASSIGHRAELWDVDHWLQVSATLFKFLPPPAIWQVPRSWYYRWWVQEVSLKIVTCDEECTIQMFDVKSGGMISVLSWSRCYFTHWSCLSVKLYVSVVRTGALFAECLVPQDAPLSTVHPFS